MTKKGAAKDVDATFRPGRLKLAGAYLRVARKEALLTNSRDIGNPAMPQVINVAITFTEP